MADAAALWAGTATGFGPDAEATCCSRSVEARRSGLPSTRLLESSPPVELELEDDEAMALFGPLAVELGIGRHRGARPDRAHAHVSSVRGDRPASARRGRWAGPIRPRHRVPAHVAGRARRRAARRRRALAARRQPNGRSSSSAASGWSSIHASPAQLSRRDEVSGADSLAAALSGTDHRRRRVLRGRGRRLGRRLRPAPPRSRPRPHEADEPAGLDAVLRPYQRRGRGLDVGDGLARSGRVLADDMGLGKTIQLIALHLRRIERGAVAGPTLVVCPASVVSNWEREIARFAPGITVHRYHGPDRDPRRRRHPRPRRHDLRDRSSRP